MPRQIGYFVGMRMCRAYYDSVPDKRAAIRTIVHAHTRRDQEQMMRAYDAALGTGSPTNSPNASR